MGLLKVINARKYTDEKEIIRQIKPLVDVYPPMNPVLKMYIVKFGKYLEHASETDSANAEMWELAIKLKANARQLIDEGNIDEAINILEQVQKYFPDDTEITEMINQIEH